MRHATAGRQATLLGWPGLGDQPSAPDVNGWDDLFRIVEAQIDGRVALVAQSMGGALAIRAALAYPQSVSHLVLTATSGGIDLSSFGTQDWREEYRRSYPGAPAWVYERPAWPEADLRTVAIPTLLIWRTLADSRGTRANRPMTWILYALTRICPIGYI
jgi:pimeloyl-ACP methyl ester carboxylesterase